MIEPWLHGSQAGFDISKALAKSKLRESHSEKVIEAGKGLHFVLAVVAGHALMKFFQGQLRHDLGENRLASVHPAIMNQPFKSFPGKSPLILLKTMGLQPSPIATLGH